jgi:hypothetical protein
VTELAMDSLTAKGSFFVSKLSSSSSSNSSTVLVSTRPRLCSSVSFPRNKEKYCNKGRLGFRVKAYDSSKDDSSSNNKSGDAKPPNGSVVIFSSLSTEFSCDFF